MADSSRTDLTGNDLSERLTRVFVDHLARNTPYFGQGGPSYYGVRLENIAPDGSELDLIVTLRAGERYCCSQPGCHFDFSSAETWSGLRGDMGLRRACAGYPSRWSITSVSWSRKGRYSIPLGYDLLPSRVVDTSMRMARSRR